MHGASITAVKERNQHRLFSPDDTSPETSILETPIQNTPCHIGIQNSTDKFKVENSGSNWLVLAGQLLSSLQFYSDLQQWKDKLIATSRVNL